MKGQVGEVRDNRILNSGELRRIESDEGWLRYGVYI